MHADTDTGADVTARALARVEAAAAFAAKVAGDQAYHPLWRAAIESVDVPLLAAIAAAAVRVAQDPQWWWIEDDETGSGLCRFCGASGRVSPNVRHMADCPAAVLHAAIRAAGEAGHV